MKVVGKIIPDPPKSKREFAALAFRKGHWVYSKRTKQWYSPEEFMQSAEVFDASEQYDNFGIYDPVIGVMEKFKVLESMVQKFGEFMGRVNGYYERKPRREPK